MSNPTRQHRVPVFYQRAWAENGRIQLHDLSRGEARTVSPRDAFVAKRVFSFRDSDGSWNAALEHHFARIETAVAPHVQRFISGADDATAVGAVQLLMATCFSRSLTVAVRSQEIATSEMPEMMSELAADPEAIRIFESDFGRPPSDGELMALVRDVWEGKSDDNEIYVNSVGRAHNFAVERFERTTLQRVAAPKHARVGLLSCDTPVVHAESERAIRVGVAEGLALGDAGFVFMPLSPQLAVCVTNEALPAVNADLAFVQRLNSTLTRRAAHRWILATPRMDVTRCFG